MKLTKKQLRRIIKEELSSVMAEVSGGAEEIERHVWQREKPRLGRGDAYVPHLDVPLIQDAMGEEYYVIDPQDTAVFRKYIQKAQEGPDGREVVVPLNTVVKQGQRVNYFKTGLTARTSVFYRLTSQDETKE
jgi:hypothetical protein